MPSFDYTAIDRKGNSIQGQIEAANRDEAALNLTRTGLLVSKLAESGGMFNQARSPVQQITQGVPAAASAPKQGLPPVIRAPSVPQSQRSPAARVTAPVNREPIRTKPGTDKDLYFIFSQLQSYAKSGQNPVVSYTNVANGCKRADFREALSAAADAAKEGRPVSDVLARYVDLFPPHVVGMVRAAEAGGFFPDAYELITDQSQASHKFRIWFKWLFWITIMVAACMPVFGLMLRAALESWEIQDKTGGTASGWGTLFGSMGRQLIWPCGPIFIVLGVGCWVFAKYWQALPRRPLRHRLLLAVPTVNRRSRAESLSVFAWTMSSLAKTGLAPKVVWELSSASIPNQEIRRQLEETGHRMSEQTRLSEAMTMSHQLPEEYAPIVQTGEVTGDIPGALLRASQSQLEEFKVNDQGSKARAGCWMFLVMIIGSAIMFGLFYGNFYGQLINKITNE